MNKDRWHKYCNEPGCVCIENDYDTIKYNISLGWSLEISEALLGEYKYGGM
tara:strand:- start:628 stop:780 length:153 start_codon:yes stop_codon:yes gene_type:complete